MSIIICKDCKYQTYCTFPSAGRVSSCDEFEDIETCKENEWDLQGFLKLWPPSEEDHSEVK